MTAPHLLAHFSKHLTDLNQKGQKRAFTSPCPNLINLSSNDYLGLADDTALQETFLARFGTLRLGASSSRLLTGNSVYHDRLEQTLETAFGKKALLFNSGYHANLGILPAIADKNTLILADKWIHASLIDGIRLSPAQCYRYRHNDYDHLHALLTRYHKDYDRIIIVTESVFSMDGDLAELNRLVALKKAFGNVLLYVDEAHAVGVYGKMGLGLCEARGCIGEIDFLVGTFGKALASFGAYVICDEVLKSYLINTARPLIFSTALPPIMTAWSGFVFELLPTLTKQRQRLHTLSQRLAYAITKKPPPANQSPIIPYIIGDNAQTVTTAHHLQALGFYCLPIRPPTVPKGTARIRFSLTAAITDDELSALIDVLNNLKTDKPQ